MTEQDVTKTFARTTKKLMLAGMSEKEAKETTKNIMNKAIDSLKK